MIFRLVLIVLAIFVLFALINYYNSKQQPQNKASFTQGVQPTQVAPPFLSTSAYAPIAGHSPMGPMAPHIQSFTERYTEPSPMGSSVNPSEENGDELYKPVDFNSQQISSDCFPKDRLVAQDLLPKDAANSKWSQVATNGQGELANQNFLTAGYHVGISSVSGSLRNANLQLRSEIPNPRMDVGPWNTSTITGDGGFRRPLEIAGDC
jgi:hypothetical protein